MGRFLVLLPLWGWSAFAQTAMTDVPMGREVAYIATASAASIGSAVLSVYLGTRIQAAYIEARGQPEPYLTPAGFALSLGLNFALMHLLVPSLTSIGNTDARAGDADSARREAWNDARWGLLGSAAGLATMFVGAGLERASFGRGQGVMLAGMLTMLVSTIATDVLEAVGAWRGYTQSRVAR